MFHQYRTRIPIRWNGSVEIKLLNTVEWRDPCHGVDQILVCMVNITYLEMSRHPIGEIKFWTGVRYPIPNVPLSLFVKRVPFLLDIFPGHLNKGSHLILIR